MLLEKIKDVDTVRKCIAKHKERDVVLLFEMEEFILNNTIELIKKSLTDNEIDY
jgi:hypothetical protein